MKHLRSLLLLAALIPYAGVSAKGVCQKPAEFVAESLGADAAVPKGLSLAGNLATEVMAILGHACPRSRLRFWRERVKRHV